MKKQFIRNAVIIVSLFGLAVWSCKDDFTEEDLVQIQAELAQQQQDHADSVAAAQQAHEDSMSLRRVNYTVTVYNASVAAANTGGRTEGLTGLNGAEVSISVNGVVQTQSTDANGMVVFENVPQGSIAGTVTMTDFSTVHFVANLYDYNDIEDPVISAGTLVPIFQLTANTATIEGRVTYEGDLLNDTEEIVPDGTVVSLNIDITDTDFILAYLSRDQGNDIGALTSIAFEGSFITTTTGGNYSINVPSSPIGLEYKISFSDFTADQNIAINNYVNGNLVRDVVTIPTLFSQSTSLAFPNDEFTNIPQIPAVLLDIDAPPPPGSGAAMSLSLIADAVDAGNGFDILAGGSGYGNFLIDVPVTVTGGDYDSSVPGATPADLRAITDGNGSVTGINVLNPGFGYRSRPTITVEGNGSGAVVVSNYASLIAPLFGTGASSGTVLSSGGSNYVLAPTADFQGIAITGDFITSSTFTNEILNGVVVNVDVPPAVLFRATPTVTFRSTPTQSPIATVDIANGQISNITILPADMGRGYNPFSLPSVNLRDLRGAGSGAVGIPRILANGNLTAIEIISHGSNYTEGLANFPNAKANFYITSLLDNGHSYNLENTVQVKSGITKVINAYYGTGIRERAIQ